MNKHMLCNIVKTHFIFNYLFSYINKDPKVEHVIIKSQINITPNHHFYKKIP